MPIARLPGLDWRWSIAVWAVLALTALVVWVPQMKRSQHRLAPTDAMPSYLSPWCHAIGWQVSLFFALHSLVFYSLVDWFASYAAASGTSIATAGAYLLVYQVVAVATGLASAPLIRRLPDQTVLGSPVACCC